MRCSPELKSTAPVSGRIFSGIPNSQFSSPIDPTSTSRFLFFSTISLRTIDNLIIDYEANRGVQFVLIDVGIKFKILKIFGQGSKSLSGPAVQILGIG